MADDIDIEEHDVLDNPRLKNIFPDITNIKTEVIDNEDTEKVYEAELSSYEIPICQQIKIERYSDDEDQYINNIQKNVIILGTKPSTPSPYSGIEPSTPQPHSGTSKETYTGVAIENHNEDLKILPCTILLKDWGELLSNNPCFCSECGTLFPTRNAFDFHNTISHSFLVAVSNSKAIKSTAKSSLDQYTSRGNYQIDLLCTHCNKYFPDQNALIKHKYLLIPNNKYKQSNNSDTEFDDTMSLKSDMTHTTNQGGYLTCRICSCYFKSVVNHNRHMLANHNMSIKDFIRVSYNSTCLFCNKNIVYPRNYNTHIQNSHFNYYFKKQNANKNRFQCSLCNLTFSSAQSERIHRATKHFDVKPAKSKVSMTLVKSEKNIVHKQLIPKSVIFKCNKCQIHFISSTVALEHSRNCNLSKGDWKCQSCRRTFKLIDRNIHTLQHELNERLRVYVVKDDIQAKVINRCGLCNVCFDDRTFLTYHASGCRPTQSVECGTCHLLIHEFSVSKHLKYHRDFNFTINDFIITDYCEVDRTSKCNDVNLDESSASTSSTSLTPGKQPKDKITYNYCSNCKSYTKFNRAIRDGHLSGACIARIKTWNVELCKLCGLTFTTKAMQSHKAYHKAGQIKLSNISFIDMLSGNKIKPPFPNFKACSKCRVRFYSATALKNHICNNAEHRACKYCKEKFSDLALKLHVPFHEYSNPSAVKLITQTQLIPPTPTLDLMKKYESLVPIWNILFLCQVCGIAVDSYSGAVEHCQNHFCNMESYNVNIAYCPKCNLKLIETCYKRHEKLHLENDINIDSFDIITYDYSTLLTDDWMKIFNRLSHDKVQQILSKSIYNNIRGVRMKLVSDGPVSYTVYKCALCNCYIETQSVVDHFSNVRDCAYFPYKLNCSICNINFINKSHKNEHEKSHQENDEPCRIILFNDDKDKFINDALITHARPEDLKFIRCNQCGKLINKGLYKAHVYKHKYVLKSKSENMMPDGMRKINRFPMKIRPKYNNSDLTFKTLLHLYKCRDCEVCVSKPSAFKHTCSKQNEKKQCTKCHLHFRYSSYTKHIRIHKQYPKMTRNNINVIYIKNNRIDRGIINAKHKTMTAKQRQIINTQKVNNTNQNKMIFYECLQCHNVVYHEANVKRHNCGNRSIIKCPKCGIRVHGSHFNAHKQLHKQRKFNKTNIVIFKFKGEKIYKPIETEYSEINEKHSEVIEKTNKVCAHLHKCTDCNLNFISRDRLLKHTLNNKCGLEEGVDCEFCNLKFERTSIHSHQINQKCSEKIISLIIVTTLDIKDRLNIWSAKHWIFYCQQCDIYSLNYNSMKYHFVCDHKAFREPINCSKCKIKFVRNCYKNHIDIHHNKLNLPVSKLNVEILVSSAIETTDMSQVDNEDLIDIDYFEDNDEPERKTETYLRADSYSYLDLSSKERNSKTPIKNVDKKIMSIDPSTSNRVQNISSEPIKTITNTSQSNVEPVKLFKCYECDVYFLTAESCYDHTCNHSPLDPTEYIACKICDLQFLCESLGRHMKGHREKKFNIDELVVDEYQINGNDITIDTYAAADRMKSKLVSTTTYSDND